MALAYALLGITRLIYFTMDRDPIPGVFKGMPAPAAALLVMAPLIMFAGSSAQGMEAGRFWGLLSCLLMILAPIVMNLYPVRYIHLGRAMSRHPWFARLTAIAGLCLVFTPYFGYAALGYMFLYLLSPLVSVFHKGVQRENFSQSRF
jgi:phosphatidylserine synthase